MWFRPLHGIRVDKKNEGKEEKVKQNYVSGMEERLRDGGAVEGNYEDDTWH